MPKVDHAPIDLVPEFICVSNMLYKYMLRKTLDGDRADIAVYS